MFLSVKYPSPLKLHRFGLFLFMDSISNLISSPVIILAFGLRINSDNWWVIALISTFAIFGMIFIIAYGVWASRRKYQIDTLKKLTTELGMDFLKRGKRNETDWCIGKYKNFNLTMQGRTVTYRGTGNVNRSSSARMEVAYVIRLCVSIPDFSVEKIKVYRGISFNLAEHEDSFESVFSYKENAEVLPESVKKALLEFARKHRGALLLQNPHEIPSGHLPEGAFEGIQIVLIHDAFMKDVKADTEKLYSVLNDLTELASIIDAK